MNAYGLLICRIQPTTLAHVELVKRTLEFNKSIILVGSDHQARSIRNPFFTNEREVFLRSNFNDADNARIIVKGIKDSSYNFNNWCESVKLQINKIVGNDTVYLVGHEKDASSYYLSHFPDYSYIPVPELAEGISATKFRENFFSAHIPDTPLINVPKYVSTEEWRALETWKSTHQADFEYLCEEQKCIYNYKKKWEFAEYGVNFAAVDCLIECNDHILLIKRGKFPGKGLYALPGGHLETDETIYAGAIRELAEETCLDLNAIEYELVNTKYFDTPGRDPRGRYITWCHHFILTANHLPEIHAADDASEAVWYRKNDIENLEDKTFIDHYQIISNMV
jgi:bifunctional NMN adenylyltransferase/nudix hydrolase